MGNSAAWQVTWNADLAHYQVGEQIRQGIVVPELEVEEDAWQEWLERISSFSFQSKDGTHVTALKERRGRGRVYWIAYRKIGGQLKRKYLGASQEVTLARLEQVASVLVLPETPIASPPSPVTSPSVIDSVKPLPVPQEPLLATKFLVPAPAHPLIHRARLETLLNEGTRHLLTLVSAPAGFGKTSLLESWVHSLPVGNFQIAWVSLDEGDNDVVRFWTYVFTALDKCEPRVSQRALTLLHAPQAPALESVLTSLINALTQTTNRYVLILDDCHLISESAIHASLDFLLEHQPPQLRLILLSRTDPPLKLSRLRARGQLLEVRDELLRCSVEEAMLFFNEVMGIRLPNDVLEQVMARTEGWLVGLQLLGLSLRGYADPADLLDALAGTERYILDYLTEEVLCQQLASIQKFLLCTSILDPLSGPLCDAVMEQANSQDVLEELERANVFVCSLDRQRRWFRYHALFAETLRYRLEQGHREGVLALHLRASVWYEQQGQTNDAIHHALQAQAWQRAADLIESETLFYRRWEQTAVLRWLRQLPKEIVYARPRLCLSYAMMLFITDQLREIEPWLQAAETALKASYASEEAASALPVLTDRDRERLLGEVGARRAIIAGYYGESDVVQNQARLALSHLSEQDVFQRAVVACAQGLSALISGQAAVSAERWREASALAQLAGVVGASVNFLSMAASYVQMQGHLHEAWRMFQQALGLGTEPTSSSSVEVGVACIYQADVLREWNQLDAALDLALQGLNFTKQAGYTKYLGRGYLVLVRIYLSRGALDAANTALRQAAQLPNLADNPYQLACLFAVEQVRLWIAQGEPDKATRWAENLARRERLTSSFAWEREEVARVRVLLARHQPDEALALLESLITGATATERFDHVIEMRILQSLAYQMRKAEREALAALAKAVRRGEPEGYIRRFVDEGPVVEELLSKLRAQSRRHGPTPYLDTVLAAFSQEARGAKLQPQQGLLDPLSERELEVLRELAQGAPNQEIADRLVITVDTVKRHVSNILAKLGVSNRTQAVARARSLGLLSDGQ